MRFGLRFGLRCGVGLRFGCGLGFRCFGVVPLFAARRLPGWSGSGCAIFGCWRQQSVVAELFEEFAE